MSDFNLTVFNLCFYSEVSRRKPDRGAAFQGTVSEQREDLFLFLDSRFFYFTRKRKLDLKTKLPKEDRMEFFEHDGFSKALKHVQSFSLFASSIKKWEH